MSKNRQSLSAWGMCPLSLLADNPTINQIKVYVSLSSFQGQNPDCYPSIEQVAERACISISSTKHAAAGLVKKGWIERRRRYGKSNLYRVLFEVEGPGDRPNDEPGDQAHEQPGGQAHEQPDSSADIVKHHSKTTLENNNVAILSLQPEENTKNDVLQIKTEFLSLAKGKRRWEARETKTAKKLLMHFPLQEILENLRVLHRETMAHSGQYGWTYSMQKLDYKWDDIQSVKEADLAERERLKRLVGYAT